MGISKYSNELKAYCIDNGLLDVVHDRLKVAYKKQDGEALVDMLLLISSHKELDCSNRLLDSKYRKYIRAREHIAYIVNNYNAVFITLTFTDEVLNNTSAETRRRYVARYLKKQGCYYVANIDYSPDKFREHYHAVVSSRVDMEDWKKYGFLFVEQVRSHDHDSKRISRYITKLTSHAFKVNATRLLYSRISL